MNTPITQQQAIQPISALEWAQYQKIGSVLMFIGIFCSFIGIGWDIEWHSDVGPDTFWTLPHIFVYSGAALAGVTSLVVVLLSSFVDRRQQANMIPVLGFFRAPIGFVMAGFGAFGFLLFGLFDQWWHTIFGFDVAISSAPHVGLLLSDILVTVGGVMIFAEGKNVRPIPLALMIALAISFCMPVAMQNFFELGWEIMVLIFPAMIIPLALLFSLSVTRQLSTVLYTGAFIFMLRMLCELAFPSMTQAYADVSGLSLRDDNEPIVAMSFFIPILVPIASLIIFAILKFAQTRAWKLVPSIYVAAALSAPVLYIDPLLGQFILQALWALPMIAVLGLGMGWLGWKLGVVARNANQEIVALEARGAA